MLHPDDHALYQRAEKLGYWLAEQIAQPCIIEPKRRPNGAGGICYTREFPPRIAILIRQKDYAYNGGAWSHRPLSWKWISEVMAHEVAHLVHDNHGPGFKDLEAELVTLIPQWELLNR